MNEAYLHYLWRMKKISPLQMQLTNGKKFEVVNFGWYNEDSGPDFFNGQVNIDGIKWHGNIEMHIRSSDWYNHKHQFDKAYDNVILHVVYEHDKEVEVNNQFLPTLELKQYINQSEFDKLSRLMLNNAWIPCESHFPVDSLSIFQQISRSLFDRLERKQQEHSAAANELSLTNAEVLHRLIFSSFGGRVNKFAFEELSNIISPKILAKEKFDQQRIEALLFGAAGFLEDDFRDFYFLNLKREWQFLKNKYQLNFMSKLTWKFKGARPTGFPTRKLAHLASFYFHWSGLLDIDKPIKDILSEWMDCLSYPINEFWANHYSFEKRSKKTTSISCSKKSAETIILNSLVNYLFYLGEKTEMHNLKDKALDILTNLKPENNSIIENWKMRGVSVKNAADSQGLIELKNQFCTFKKCLKCKIGHSILNQ